jgi:hypothetical protein
VDIELASEECECSFRTYVAANQEDEWEKAACKRNFNNMHNYPCFRSLPPACLPSEIWGYHAWRCARENMMTRVAYLNEEACARNRIAQEAQQNGKRVMDFEILCCDISRGCGSRGELEIPVDNRRRRKLCRHCPPMQYFKLPLGLHEEVRGSFPMRNRN